MVVLVVTRRVRAASMIVAYWVLWPAGGVIAGRWHHALHRCPTEPFPLMIAVCLRRLLRADFRHEPAPHVASTTRRFGYRPRVCRTASAADVIVLVIASRLSSNVLRGRIRKEASPGDPVAPAILARLARKRLSARSTSFAIRFDRGMPVTAWMTSLMRSSVIRRSATCSR